MPPPVSRSGCSGRSSASTPLRAMPSGTSRRRPKGGSELRLNLMVSYGGREELVRAVRLLSRMAGDGLLDPGSIDADLIEGALYTAGLPDPDLLVRTSGEQRVSNFMLWQLAYTEIHITPALWPDFDRDDFYAALLDYQRRERRFGEVGTR